MRGNGRTIIIIYLTMIIITGTFIICDQNFELSDYNNLLKDKSQNVRSEDISNYSLNIEVDYYPNLLKPEIIDAFDFLIDYYSNRDIEVNVTFESPNNVIEIGNGFMTYWDTWREVERQYHDYPDTHIHFIIASRLPGNYDGGVASHTYGAGISLDSSGSDYGDIRFLIMHEIGHCIGIGLHDDEDGSEVYSSGGFMQRWHIGWPNTNFSAIEEYADQDWEDAFAPDGAFGNTNWCSARIWNRFSVIGEIYDNSSDIIGRIVDKKGLAINGTRLELISENVNLPPISYYSPYGFFEFRVSPGNYLLEIDSESSYSFSDPFDLTIEERQIYELGNLTATKKGNYKLLVLTSLSSIIIVLALIYIRKKNTGSRAK